MKPCAIIGCDDFRQKWNRNGNDFEPFISLRDDFLKEFIQKGIVRADPKNKKICRRHYEQRFLDDNSHEKIVLKDIKPSCHLFNEPSKEESFPHDSVQSRFEITEQEPLVSIQEPSIIQPDVSNPYIPSNISDVPGGFADLTKNKSSEELPPLEMPEIPAQSQISNSHQDLHVSGSIPTSLPIPSDVPANHAPIATPVTQSNKSKQPTDKRLNFDDFYAYATRIPFGGCQIVANKGVSIHYKWISGNGILIKEVELSRELVVTIKYRVEGSQDVEKIVLNRDYRGDKLPINYVKKALEIVHTYSSIESVENILKPHSKS